jgi:hypothetical protein
MSHPRTLAAEMARELLAALAGDLSRVGRGVRVVEAAGGLGCLVLVWGGRGMPPVSAERRGPTRRRAGCKADILEVVREAGRPLTFKEVVRALREAGLRHGRGTVMKALAELTAGGELINHRDKKGYRLPAWRRDDTPGLF